MKRLLILLLAVLLGTGAPAPVHAADAGQPRATEFFTHVTGVNEHGSLFLELTAEDMHKRTAITYDDLVNMSLNGRSWANVPVVRRYTDVAAGFPMLIERGGRLLLSFSYGSFAQQAALYHEESKKWVLNDGVDLAALPVRVTLEKKGAYAPTRQMRLHATYKREDYASDAIFANFRVVGGGKLGANALYRSSIPSSLTRARAPYADSLAAEAGIKTFLNLANPPDALKANMTSPKCQSPYYRSVWKEGGVITEALPAVFDRPSFKAGLARQLRFLITRPGPYLVHCAEGKDRAGFTAFLLAALMGADYAELERDYGESFLNYYHLKVGEKRYVHYVNSGIRYFMRVIGAPENAQRPAAEAESYLRGCGLTGEEIAQLKDRLGRTWPVERANEKG